MWTVAEVFEMLSAASLTEHSLGFPQALWLLFIFIFPLPTCVANNLVFLEGRLLPSTLLTADSLPTLFLRIHIYYFNLYAEDS